MFGTREVCDLTGLNRETLRVWLRKKFIRPAKYGVGGPGCDHQWSAWQVVALSILAAALQEAKRGRYRVGYTGIGRAWDALSGRSDEELLAEDQQSLHVAERAAAIAHQALNAAALTPAMYDNLAKTLAAIEERAAETHARNMGQRVQGEFP
jgi:hypothetical protein